MRYKYLMFDLDGTLIDSKNSICLALNKTLNYFGKESLDFNYSKKYIGTPLKKVLSSLSLDPEKAIEIYRPYYFELMKDHQFIYEGIIDIITKLRQFSKTILVTNKGRNGTDLSLEYANLNGFFDFTITETEVKEVKPFTEMFILIKNYLSSNKYQYSDRDFLMIGDSPVDCDFAKNCNIDFAFASWGFYDLKDFKIPPKYILEKPKDLIKLI